ncbi:hypothetical protein GCM10027170_01320 [Aliiglaciecola aliphaticivorans]
MKVTVIEEPLLEFGKGTHICPRNGIERMGVYDTPLCLDKRRDA